MKWLGDGVMLDFEEPGNAVLAALDMVEGVATHALPPAHVGIHAGPVVFQEGDYFGRTVNIAARIAEYARPGEVLVTQEVVDAADDGTSVKFTEIGPVELKGVPGTRPTTAPYNGKGRRHPPLRRWLEQAQPALPVDKDADDVMIEVTRKRTSGTNTSS